MVEIRRNKGVIAEIKICPCNGNCQVGNVVYQARVKEGYQDKIIYTLDQEKEHLKT